MSNIYYQVCQMHLVFGKPNTKKSFLWNVLNAINFDTHVQYHSIFGTIRTNMLKKKNYSFSLSFFIHFLSSLSYFFLLSFSACSLSSVTSSSLSLLLSSPTSSPLPFIFPLSLLCVHFTTILFHTFSLNKNSVEVL